MSTDQISPISDLISVKQAAKVLGITPMAVYGLVRAKKIGHYRIGTGRGSIRFRSADVEDFLESCFHAPSMAADLKPRKTTRRVKTKTLAGLKYVGDCL